MATLPDLFNFGDIPIEMFPDFDPLKAEDLTSITQTQDRRIPLGIDLAIDLVDGNLKLSSGLDFQFVDEQNSLMQWVSAALATPVGRYILYDHTFGSGLNDLLHLGFSPKEVLGEIILYIKTALLTHDRISHLTDFRFQFSDGTTIASDSDIPNSSDETIIVSFTVVTDTDERLQFQGLAVD